jgi:hypothetical protein
VTGLSVTGLTNSTPYTFKIRSRGRFGVDDSTGTTASVTPSATTIPDVTGVVDGLDELGDILIGKMEVSPEFYDAVKGWAKANKGYNFIHTGINIEHSAQVNGPAVGGIGFLEAVVWCNALTEYYNDKNGLTGSDALIPVYLGCVAPTDNTPLTARDVTRFYHYGTGGLGGQSQVTTETSGKLGFRLPIKTEWEAGYNAGKYSIPSGGFPVVQPVDWTFTYYSTISSAFWYYTGNPVTGLTSAYSLQVNLSEDVIKSFRIAIKKTSL